jgi:small-conductance mechanosensitive channel
MENVNVSVGLPPDTPIDLLKEALEALVNIKKDDSPNPEVALKDLGIWEWISKASDTSTVISSLLSAAGPMLAFINGAVT